MSDRTPFIPAAYTDQAKTELGNAGPHKQEQRLAAQENPVHPVANMLRELGREEGVEVQVEPTWQHMGRIKRRDGTVTFFRGTNFDLNGMGSMEIARDKGYAAYFLEQAGYSVIPGKTFFSPEFAKILKSNDGPEAACRYAEEQIGWPVV